MNGQIITVALILLGHIFLTPAVQAIGFDGDAANLLI